VAEAVGEAARGVAVGVEVTDGGTIEQATTKIIIAETRSSFFSLKAFPFSLLDATIDRCLQNSILPWVIKKPGFETE
jgi:hypothetical protein